MQFIILCEFILYWEMEKIDNLIKKNIYIDCIWYRDIY